MGQVIAKSGDMVRIEQVGGYKEMPGWMWVEAIAERDRLLDQIEKIKEMTNVRP